MAGRHETPLLERKRHNLARIVPDAGRPISLSYFWLELTKPLSLIPKPEPHSIPYLLNPHHKYYEAPTRMTTIRGHGMKVLVAYMSSTGNTKKVAEAIYGEITSEKEIRRIEDVQDIGIYDLSFLGFPTRQFGPDKKTKEFLEKQCKEGRKVALFVTHCAPEDVPEVQEWMAKFKQAAAGANLVGFFDCQGELAKGVEMVMKIAPRRRYGFCKES
jgi:flavodoxin